VQAAVGEIIAMRNVLWGLTTAMVNDTVKLGENGVVPNPEMAAGVRYYMGGVWDNVRDIFQKYLAGAPIYTISNAADYKNEEFKPFIDQYFRGTGKDALDRIKLFKMVWDSLYSEFAGRNGLYERNYSGSYDMQQIDNLMHAEKTGSMNKYRRMLQESMDDYTVDGWVRDWGN
jgi:aromatic ring hydroxylase